MKKRKKKHIDIQNKTISKNKSIIKFFKNNTKFLVELLILFSIAFIFTTIIALQRQPINTHKAYGDNYYYHYNAKLLTKIWHSPFKYGIGLLTHSLSEKEALDIGFNHDSGFNSFFRAPSFILYHSFWLFIFGDSEFSNLLSQTFLFSLIILLIYYILYKKINRKYAIFGTFLTFLYIPFHTSATITMTELWQAGNLLILYIISEKIFISKKMTWKKGLILSLSLLFVTLAKSSLKYFYIFFLIMFIALIIQKYDKKILKKTLILLLISFIITFIFWGVIASNNTHEHSVGNSLGWLVFWAGGIPETEGKIPYNGVHTKEFRDNINKGTANFWYNRYAQVCKYAMIQLIKKRPISYSSMVIKKIDALIIHPAWFNHSNLHLHKIKKIYLRPYHIFLFLSMLLAIFYLQGKTFYYFKYFFSTILAYFFLIYGMANPSTRFFLPLVPFYIIFTTLLLNKIILKKQFLFLGQILLSLGLYYVFFRKNILIHILPNLVFISLVKFFGLLFLFFYLLYLIYKSYSEKLLITNKNNAEVEQEHYIKKIYNFFFKQDEKPIYLFFVTLFFLSAIASNFNDLQLNHFLYKSKQMKIQEKIILDNKDLQKIRKDSENIFLALDLRPFSKKDFIWVKVNKLQEKKIFLTNAIETTASNIKPKYYNVNKWIFYPLNKTNIQTTNIISIRTSHAPGMFYHIITDSPPIPSLFNRFSIDIVEGFNTLTDGRIMQKTRLNQKQRKSFINKKILKNKDFNIFILRKEQGTYYFPKKYEKLMDANIKYIALINPIDRKLVFWSKKNPGEDYVVVRGNLYRYIAGELDRFYSGYHIY